MERPLRDGELSLYLTRLFLPVTDTDGANIVLAADLSAENRAWLNAYLDRPVFRPVGRGELLAAIQARYGDALLDQAIFALARRSPELSAQTVVTRPQMIVSAAAAAVFLTALILFPQTTWRDLVALMSAAYIASGLFRFGLSFLGTERREPVSLSDVALPLYTILVPLYREAAVLPTLVQSLAALDYPRDRLDVKIVLEEDDAETIDAAARLLSSGCSEIAAFEIIRVPPGGPRTKPKAANFALAFARGDYLVVYDAEDRPEACQLKQAVATFRSLPRATACLQARLQIHNTDCWLAKMFALDYAVWFGALLQGLDRLGVPMPLGGTSNHFRTAVLRDIGGWDAFNVTEDADIGIRLAQLGYGVSMLDSVTYEEAPTRLGVWLRQRSRWMKGYMQTWLVHMRDPIALARRTGLLGFLSFQLFVGGGLVFALVNPPLWLAFLGAVLFFHRGGNELIPAASLLMNNAMLTWLAVMGARGRGRDNLWPYGLTVVAYWAMISVAGYRGIFQLITRPFYWEKTAHGAVPDPCES